MFDLKRFRKDYKLKQSELADILGIVQSFISDIENGKAPFPEMHYETLVKNSEDALKNYKTGSINVKGDNNMSNTGVIGGNINSGKYDGLVDLYVLEEFIGFFCSTPKVF